MVTYFLDYELLTGMSRFKKKKEQRKNENKDMTLYPNYLRI